MPCRIVLLNKMTVIQFVNELPHPSSNLKVQLLLILIFPFFMHYRTTHTSPVKCTRLQMNFIGLIYVIHSTVFKYVTKMVSSLQVFQIKFCSSPYLFSASYMPCQFYTPVLNCFNNIQWTVQTVTFQIMLLLLAVLSTIPYWLLCMLTLSL